MQLESFCPSHPLLFHLTIVYVLCIINNAIDIVQYSQVEMTASATVEDDEDVHYITAGSLVTISVELKRVGLLVRNIRMSCIRAAEVCTACTLIITMGYMHGVGHSVCTVEP